MKGSRVFHSLFRYLQFCDPISQSDQKFCRSAGHELIIEKPYVQKVNVVTDKMSRHAIDGAKEENRIVRIDWVMAEVEVSDFDSICQEEKTGEEGPRRPKAHCLFQSVFPHIPRRYRR